MTHLRQSSDLAPKEGREFMRRGTGFRGSKRLNRAQEKREIRRALLLGRQIGKQSCSKKTETRCARRVMT